MIPNRKPTSLEDAYMEPYFMPPLPAENQNNSQGLKTVEAENVNTFTSFFAFTNVDNFDASNNLQLRFTIPRNSVQIASVTLDIYSQKYRGYNIANANESSHTHNFVHTHGIDHDHTGTANHAHTNPSTSHTHSVSSAPGTTGSYTFNQATDSAMASFATDLTFGLISDNSSITNTQAGSAHTHGVTYGIFEDTYAHSMGIVIDGTNRTTVLGGSWNPDTTSGDRIIQGLNITPYVINSSVNRGSHLIELTTTQNGRAIIQIYVKCIFKL